MDLQLVAALVVGVGVIILLILKSRFDAFMALLTGAVLTGLVAGVPAAEVAGIVSDGFGSTLGSIGIVIGLGVMIGKILEITGAADVLAGVFVRLAGKGREDWGLAGTGALVSIPVFCDSGYIILNPLARSLTRRSGRSWVTMSLALAAGLIITHHLVPPTPGPLAVAGLFGLDLGRMILGGVVFAVPMVVAAVFYARYIGPKLDPSVNDEVRADVSHERVPSGPEGSGAASAGGGGTSAPAAGAGAAGVGSELREGPEGGSTPADHAGEGVVRGHPNAFASFAPLILPLLLILGNTVATTWIDEGNQVRDVLAFVGDPIVAVLIGLVLALYTLLPKEIEKTTVTGWLVDAAGSAGVIIFITGAGGALGNVLRESGVADELARTVADWSIPDFLIPFAIASFVRVAQGSGTVAMITAGSLTAPLLGGLDLDPLVAALACVTGAMVFSYFNDSFFWVVTRFTGLEGTAALRAWSGMTTVLWFVALVEVAVASVVL